MEPLLKNNTAPQASAAIPEACLNFFRIMTTSMYEAICFIDGDGIVRVWNPSAVRLYGLPASDIIGRPVRDFFPTALVDEVRLSRNPRENVYHSPRPHSHILATAMPVYVDGVFIGAMSSDRDYAEVRQLYSQLADAESRLLFLENEMKKNSAGFSNIIGNTPGLQKRVANAKQIAPTSASVMLTGESGTGKEMFAQGIHEYSGRKGLFVAVNCNAIPADLFESEFFGYAPGAFTGAGPKGKPGIFEMANNGSVFLDEIGDLPPFIQGKLLRVLQEREMVRVGGDKVIKLDVRLISATNRSLKDMIAQGTFRQDLYYRLNVVEIDLPPLRQRKEDIPLLINYFNHRFAERNNKKPSLFSPAALRVLSNYDWPGNIRELMNVVENIVVTHFDTVLQAEDLPSCVQNVQQKTLLGEELPLELSQAVRMVEKVNILRALELCAYNKSKAASVLNIPRPTLYSKMRELGISIEKRHKGRGT